MKSTFATTLATLSFFITIPLYAQQGMLKLEDIFGSKQFAAAGLPEVRSMNDGVHFTELTNEENMAVIVKNDYKTGKTVDTLFKSTSFSKDNTPVSVSDYQLSNDESKIILSTESESIYRHSTKANNFIYDIKSKSVTPVSLNGKQQYGTFSPDGKAVAFVRDNNLFIKDLV